jgi:hypothetical protein
VPPAPQGIALPAGAVVTAYAGSASEGTITRQSCGLGLFAALDGAADGPGRTCARLSGTTPVKAPTGTGSGSGTVSGPVSSGGRLPATGTTPLLGLGGLLAVGAVAVLRRRTA